MTASIQNDTPVGIELLANPATYIAKKRPRDAVFRCIDRVLNDVIIDLNAELDQAGEDFDYRGKLRDEAWIKATAHRLVADYTKLVTRGRIESFQGVCGSNEMQDEGKGLITSPSNAILVHNIGNAFSKAKCSQVMAAIHSHDRNSSSLRYSPPPESAAAVHDGRLRLRIPARTAARGGDVRPRRAAPGMNAILRVFPESGSR